MSKFKKKGDKGSPAISTASLPDIVFMLLFFFMVATVMREQDLLVEMEIPEANQIEKLENKSLVAYVNVGRPSGQLAAVLGDEHRVQLGDDIQEVDQIANFVAEFRETVRERDGENAIGKITFALKVDNEAKMKLISDIKYKLREVNALKINYSTNIGSEATIE